MTEKQYLICLYAFLPFGPLRTKLLISYFGSAGKVWQSNPNQLKAVGLKPKIVEDFLRFRDNFDILRYFNKIKKQGVYVVTYKDAEYPQNLRDLDNAPCVLYIRGNLPNLKGRSLAVVGSRKMTSYGREVAYKISYDLSKLGVVIVSGLALGIDAVAHQAALDAGGTTVAILASGVDILTPSTNRFLGERIIAKSGAVVSEYPPGTVPVKNFFPNRNRIIAGLSNALLVVEAAIQSGTFHTVNAANDYGRTVFAVPGPITYKTSEFPNYLIKNGAKVVTDSQDVLDEFSIVQNSLRENEGLKLTKKESKLLEILASEPQHLDNIVRITTWKVSDVSATLTVMELKGLIKSIDSGAYRKIS